MIAMVPRIMYPQCKNRSARTAPRLKVSTSRRYDRGTFRRMPKASTFPTSSPYDSPAVVVRTLILTALLCAPWPAEVHAFPGHADPTA